MRRFIVFFVVLFLLFVIACSKSPTKPEPKPINFVFTAENNSYINIYRISRCVFPSVGVPIF